MTNGLKAYGVTPDVFKRISYRQGPDGLLAVVKNHHPHVMENSTLIDIDDQLRISSSAPFSQSPFFLVVQGVEKPGNLGALFRNVDFFGANGILVCDPVCEVFNTNVIRASQGSVFTVPFAITSTSQVMQYMEDKGITPYVTYASTDNQDQQEYNVRSLYDLDMTQSMGIVMGSEANGVSAEMLQDQRCRNFLTVPKSSQSVGVVDSLNVSTAAAAILSEMNRQRGPSSS